MYVTLAISTWNKNALIFNRLSRLRGGRTGIFGNRPFVSFLCWWIELMIPNFSVLDERHTVHAVIVIHTRSVVNLRTCRVQFLRKKMYVQLQ